MYPEQVTIFVEFNGPPTNHLVLKGVAGDRFGGQHPVKFILPANFPQSAPMCYFDKQLSIDIVQKLDYLGN